MKPVTFDIYEEESRNIGYHCVSRGHVQVPRRRTECPGLYVQVFTGAMTLDGERETRWCMLHVGHDGKFWIDRSRGFQDTPYGWESTA